MPKIIESTGDIFASGCEALVSPVDTTGAQGAGLAKAFARRFCAQTGWYRRHAGKGYAEPGQVYHVLPKSDEDRLHAARWVLERHRSGAEPLVLFATSKAHYRRPSKLRWVTGCIAALVEAVNDLGIRSIAIPALGCGRGQAGIKPEDAFGWDDVRPLLLSAAEKMQCERVVIYSPR